MKKTVLREYARLIVRSGVNVQKGQEVLDSRRSRPAGICDRWWWKSATRPRRRRSVVDWNYQPLQKLHVRHQSVTTHGSRLDEYAESQIAALCGHDPLPHLPDVRRPRRAEGHQSWRRWPRPSQQRYPIIKPYRDQMENKYQWCIAAVPGAAWAKKLFPGTARQRTPWRSCGRPFCSTSRVTDDPVTAWEAHNAGPARPLRLPQQPAHPRACTIPPTTART